jgi:NAD(P)-dependent dehydrogenase (short-subunit alcohol dehydrogenase family)
MRLNSKKVLITGGSSGIGRAIAKLFAQEGASLVIGDIDVKGGQETLEQIGSPHNARFIETDISNEISVRDTVYQANDFLRGVDILINNAAAFVFGTVEQTTTEDWKRVMGVNVVGSANMVKHSLPFLKKSAAPAIVNIASVSGFIAQPAFVPYNASKGAVLQLTRCLAMDLAEFNIRVNSVCPGAIFTPASERHMAFAGVTKEEFVKEASESAFMKRVGKPIEIAYAALFLASEEASFITGTHLTVDGGRVG